MKYIGSKARLAKHFLPIMLPQRKPNQYWVEPFVGGCNMIDKVKGARIGNDVNKDLIDLWKALQEGWEPPKEISYFDYIGAQSSMPSVLRTYIGFMASFSGKFFGGFARGKGRDYAKEAYQHLKYQVKYLQGVEFVSFCYTKLPLPEESFIYCDPPYKGTLGYQRGFDHEEFYEWCIQKKDEGHPIYISEYKMPKPFKCLLAVERAASVDLDTGGKVKYERLYTLC